MVERYILSEQIAGNEYGLQRIQIAGNEYALRTKGMTPCNACDPPIPDTLYVTFAGLAGDLAVWNGKHELTWVFTCTWETVDTFERLAWRPMTNDWFTYAGTGTCAKSWHKVGTPCDPIGNYTELACNDAGCVDGNSCENSVGATAVVSLT